MKSSFEYDRVYPSPNPKEYQRGESIMTNMILSIPYPFTVFLIAATLGAAGAIEAVLSLLMMQEGILFPNLNMTTPDPLLPAAPLKIKSTLPITHILSNSFGFGGNDTSLIFSSNSSHDTA